MIDNRVIPYPKGKAIEKKALFDWFDDIVKGKVAPKTDNFSKEVVDKDIQKILLNNTMIATRENFDEIVL